MSLNANEFVIYGRLSIAHLFKPHKSKDFTEKNDAGVEVPKERYKLNLLMNPKTAEGKASLAKLEAAMKSVAMEKVKKWPLQWADPKRFCLRDGNTCLDKSDEPYDGCAGMMVLSMARHPKDGPPGVFDADTSPLTLGDTKPYNGCWVRVHGDIWMTDKGGRGMFCGLRSVKFVKDDEPLKGGGVSAPTASVFEDDEEV